MATLTAIQAMVYGLEQTLGDAGLIIGTLLASLFEVHGAIATVVMQGPPSQKVLLYALILGLVAHAIAKCVNAVLIGGLRFALYFTPAQILHMLALVAILYMMV